MIFRIKKIGVLALVILVCLISAVSINLSKSYVLTSTEIVSKPQIILDAGHGGLTNTTH